MVTRMDRDIGRLFALLRELNLDENTIVFFAGDNGGMDRFVDEADFFSIGSNDLIQYALAGDRSNKDVAGLYTAADPSVIRLIDMSIKAADRANVPINLCGQMSGSPTYTMLLLGMGLRCLSVTPGAVPEIKKICRSVTIEQCETVSQKVMTLEGARDIARLRASLMEFVEVAPIVERLDHYLAEHAGEEIVAY